MEPNISGQSIEQKKQKLKDEIAELENASKQLGAASSRVLRLGCPGMILITLASLAVWVIPRPIPTGFLVVIIAVGAIGLILMLQVPTKGKKKEELAQENARFKEIVTRLQEKRAELSKMKKLN